MKKALIMLSLLVIPRLLVAQDLDLERLAGEDWYGLYFNGQKSGFARSSLELGEDKSVSIEFDATFRVTQNGVPQEVQISETRQYAPDGELDRLSASTVTDESVTQFEGVVKEDKLYFTSTIAGATSQEVLPKPSETLLDALREAKLVTGDPEVGDSIKYSRFETMFKREVKGESTIAGKEDRVLNGVSTTVYRVKTEEPAIQLSMTAYVAQDGTVLEDSVGGLLTTRLEPKEVAQNVDYSYDVIVSNAALVDHPIENPRQRESLSLVLRGPLEQFHLFNDDRQYMAEKNGAVEFTATRIDLEGFTPVELPVENEAVAEWTKPTTFIQSSNERIVRQAREIVGDEKDAFEVAKKLCQWVSDNVESTYSASLSNAAEVLDIMKGDCTEHSVLFIALARAAGLPAREVGGLVYVHGNQPGFYFHQWAKVWIGRWIDVDPTFNQPLVDATHVKLSEGDLFDQVKLLPVMGQIRIEVVEKDAAVAKED